MNGDPLICTLALDCASQNLFYKPLAVGVNNLTTGANALPTGLDKYYVDPVGAVGR